MNQRIQEKDKIQIPKPTYGKGANIRSRFAFGKITKEQARQNTTKQYKESIHNKESQKNTTTEENKNTEENKEKEQEKEQEKQTETPLIYEDKILQERIRIEEEEEEDIFFGNDEPSIHDIA